MRAYLLRLQHLGLGSRRVAILAGLTRQQVLNIRRRRPRMRWVHWSTAAKILAVPLAPALGATRSAAATVRLIRDLRRERYTLAHIARELGHRARLPHLQLGDRVTLRTELKMRRLHRKVLE